MADLRTRLAAKQRVAYPAQATRRVQMVSYREDNPASIVGSYSFRAQRYPADIDTMDTAEDIKVEGEWRPATTANTHVLVAEFVRRLQDVTRSVANAESTFYLEVKAGYDWGALAAMAPIGDMHDGVFTPAPNLRATIMLAKGRGLVDDQAATRMLVALTKGPSLGAAEYDLISTELRKAYVMRWSVGEVLAGTKMRGPGAGKTLAEAVYAEGYPPTLVKIDVITKIRGSFLELSNIYILREVRDDGSYLYLTSLPSIDGVTLDIEKMLFSPMWYNPFKAIKRMFVFARARYLAGDERLAGFLEAALAYLGGDEAIYYQIKSDLETLVKLLRDFQAAIDRPGKHGAPTYFAMASELDGIKGRLANTSMPELDVARLSSSIDDASHAPHPEAAQILENIEKALKGIVKESAIKWLNANGLSPPSVLLEQFLPTEQLAARLDETTGPLDPLLRTQHRRTYDWSARSAPVAAGEWNTMRGGSELGVCPEADARGRLSQIILAHE
jgi:hypothetical protein